MTSEEEIDFEQLLNEQPQHKTESKKPRATPNLIEQSHKRKEYFKTLKDHHHQKVLT